MIRYPLRRLHLSELGRVAASMLAALPIPFGA